MIVCVDFDDTVVEDSGRDYSDVTTPLKLKADAIHGLRALKRAGHVLLLYSARANRSLRFGADLDPLVRAGVRKAGPIERERAVHEARYEQMVRFAHVELKDIFDAIDDGQQGKPVADLYIDDKALRLGHGTTSVGWNTVAAIYGDTTYEDDET